MRQIFWRIYVQPIWCVPVEMLLLLVLWSYLGRKAKARPVWKCLNALVLLVIVFAILYNTVWSRDYNPKPPAWIPFQTFEGAKLQPELYRAMLMNVFLFEPIGLSLPHLLPKKAHPVLVTILSAMVFSTAIEATQFFLGLGCSEIDDVMMNTLGAALGTLAYRFSQRKNSDAPP